MKSESKGTCIKHLQENKLFRSNSHSLLLLFISTYCYDLMYLLRTLILQMDWRLVHFSTVVTAFPRTVMILKIVVKHTTIRRMKPVEWKSGKSWKQFQKIQVIRACICMFILWWKQVFPLWTNDIWALP